jgi:hypothetical protein
MRTRWIVRERGRAKKGKVEVESKGNPTNACPEKLSLLTHMR